MHKYHIKLSPAERFFYHYYNEIPPAMHPFVSWLLLGVGVLFYLCALILIGRWTQSKGQRFWLGFALALVNGPLLGSLFVAFLRDASGTGSAKSPKRKLRKR